MSIYDRFVKETLMLMSDPVEGISAIPHADNKRYFDVTLAGPPSTPFEGGLFRLELFLPAEYPMVAPKIRFLTKIYHPNVDRLGRICMDTLKDKWSPAFQIRSCLISIQVLMSSPNPDDPFDNRIADHWKTNESAALAQAREWTRMYAV